MLVHHTAVNIHSHGITAEALPNYIQYQSILLYITVTTISQIPVILKFSHEFILPEECNVSINRYPAAIVAALHDDLLPHQHSKAAEHVIPNVKIHFGSMISRDLTEYVLVARRRHIGHIQY